MKKLHRTILPILTAVAVAILAYWSMTNTDVAPDQSTQPEKAIVAYVVDGDTIDLKIDGIKERVRLIGIDTPETVNQNTPIQCFGSEASEALRKLLPIGASVRIIRDAEARDRYDRLLLYVYRSQDELFINHWMVENGYASAISYRPNTAFESDFLKAENEAKRQNVGLWRSCDGPDQPLD